jgi:hypothetical protein
MRLSLQLVALVAAAAVMWIAFAHRIRTPIGTTDSIAVPLILLCACAVGLAWSYRASLQEALRRAADGTSNASDERAARITIGLLLVSGFLLRIARTGEYGLNPDEAQLVWVGAAATLADMWAYETLVSPHPPGIFFLFHYMLQISWDPLWLRLPAVLGGTFSIWLSYRFARELLGARVGVAIAWLVAFSPPLLELSRIARNYAVGFAFIVLALFLFVRFLKTHRWRYFAGYTAAATIAVAWHYFFIVVFIALKLVLAIQLLRQRAPLRSWLGVGAIQLCFAGAMMLLYLQHIAVLPPDLTRMLDFSYRGKAEVGAFALLDQLNSLWHFLAPGWACIPLMILCGVGIVVLAAGRRWLALGFCTLPLLVALGFSWSSTIPLGGSRHSAYLFPFLFLLVACNAPEITTGYRATRSNLARLAPRLRWLEPGGAPSLWAAGWGSAAAAALAALFAVGSLLEYNGESDRYPFAKGGYQGYELVRRYHQADVERAFELLAEYAGPNDWVLLDFEGAYALRLYFQLRPILRPDEADLIQRDISLIVAGTVGPQRHRHDGVQYYHSGSFHPELSAVWKNLKRVRKYYHLKMPRKVWLMQGAWSAPFMERFNLERGRAPIDWRAYDESNGMLLGIKTSRLRSLATLGK